MDPTPSTASASLKRGEPVAFPTETVYGLGAPVFSPATIQKIYALKKRPQDNPLIVHISNFAQLGQIVESYPEELARHFWPGPLTLILPKKACVPSIVSAGLPTIGVRMPAHPLALALIEAVDEPLVAPSANLSGRPSCTTAAHVRQDFGEELLVLDGGPCKQGLESTVLSLDPLMILRPGSITKEELEDFMGEPIGIAEGECNQPPAPGMKYQHYTPRAHVRLVSPDEKVEPALKRLILYSIKPSELYAVFRAADERGVEEIVVVCDASTQSNAALMNRLIRAAH
ncbi:MAG: Threonylcarbamoyl-AMP synthase [Chlamydiales bacterium]|nr:Threonylcarbamoyl-AMP synthase [Chlamydiales bacterium]